jgi:radical SAM protein with 4Fe4S-binding SPASM domain
MAQKIFQLSENRMPLGKMAPLQVPLVIYVEASSYCNLACNFCPHYLEPERMNKLNMSLDVFKKVIDDIYDFQSPIKMLRMCGTGDSLMNKNLIEMLDYAGKKKNFDKFELITNGLLLDSDLINALTINLTRLIISVEGLNDDDYLKFTNRKVNFEKFKNKIQGLYENKGNCKIHIKIHNNAVNNQEKQDLFYSLFKDYCDEIYIENLVDLWPSTDSKYVTSGSHRFSGSLKKEVTACSQIFKTMQINSNGSVIPCSIDWESLNIIGDINQTKLIEIWNGDFMREIRLKHLNNERKNFLPCSACSFNEASDVDNIDNDLNDIKRRMHVFE